MLQVSARWEGEKDVNADPLPDCDVLQFNGHHTLSCQGGFAQCRDRFDILPDGLPIRANPRTGFCVREKRKTKMGASQVASGMANEPLENASMNVPIASQRKGQRFSSSTLPFCCVSSGVMARSYSLSLYTDLRLLFL
jgi:hypothetical protein